jgi:DNA ligase D-like protein (predicted 3'-phosphoesterase)
MLEGYMSKDELEGYRKKRDLRKTPEPSGGSGPSDEPIFVIQKHDASNLHYDFRLEVGGVLKSFAVPKGPSTDPRERRLAIQTEDHPLKYADFEGVIPEEEYGGGTVMVWDKGTYRNLKEEDGEEVPMEKTFENGHVNVWLDGEKIKGGYALVRTGGKKEQWLMIKMKDDEADARRNPATTEPRSVKTGRTMEEIREEED